jgi:hypothetical protein
MAPDAIELTTEAFALHAYIIVLNKNPKFQNYMKLPEG